MIKLILIACLSVALSGPAYGHSESQEVFDPNCLFAGSAKIKLLINVPPGACGCSSEEEDPDLCLGLENSKKISDAVLDILEHSGNSYQVIEDLQIHRFMAGMDFNDFAKNIKDNDFDFEGFSDLKELVNKYKICKKECKVYYTLRKAFLENAANAAITENEHEDGSATLTVEGDIIILGDVVKELQEKLVSDIRYNSVVFKTKTFVADVNLVHSAWRGKFLRVEADNLVVLSPLLTWDVTADGSDNGVDGSVDIVGYAAWDFGATGENKLESYPAYNFV